MINTIVLTPKDKVAVAAIIQMVGDLAAIREKVNLIEDRLESITVSVDEIECCLCSKSLQTVL
jgi:hypothetical protein